MKRKAFIPILAVFTMGAAARAAEMNIFAEPAKPVYRARKAPQPAPEAAKVAPAAAEKAPSEKIVNGPVATPQWVQSMEASVNSPLSPHSTTSFVSAWGMWTGWLLAGLFGFLLFVQGARDRRARNLVRAGTRDAFFLPPTRRRL